MKILQSLAHDLVKKVVRLHDAKGRKQEALFLAEGRRAIESFMQARFEVVHFFVTEDFLSDPFVTSFSFPLVCVSAHVMDKISAAQSPSGMLAVFAIPEQEKLSDISGPAVVLVDIADPGNVGTLLRSSIAFGFSPIVVGGADCWSPKVVQASAGALALSAPLRTTWPEVVEWACQYERNLCAMVVAGGSEPEKINFNEKTVLVLGSEAHGLSPDHQSACRSCITLSMPGNTESLNVAIAGSIGMYIVARRLQ